MALKDWRLERKEGNFSTYINKENKSHRVHLRYNPITSEWQIYATDGSVEIWESEKYSDEEKKEAKKELNRYMKKN